MMCDERFTKRELELLKALEEGFEPDNEFEDTDDFILFEDSEEQ